MSELQRYMLFGVALIAPILALYWLDILRARYDAAFHTAFPRRGRLAPSLFLLTLTLALLAAAFPPGLSPMLRVLVALACVAASALVGAGLFLIVRRLPARAE